MNWIRSLLVHLSRTFGELPWLAMVQGAVGLALIAEFQLIPVLAGLLLWGHSIRAFHRTFDEARWSIAIADFDSPVRARTHVATERDGGWSSFTESLVPSAVEDHSTTLAQRRERWEARRDSNELIHERLTRPKISLRP